MPKKLSLPEQRALYQALPTHRKKALAKYCKECSMRGEGLKEIKEKIGSVLGPVAREVGATVTREIIIPLIIKKGKEKAGLGLSPAGGALKLAGQGKRTPKYKKGSAEAKAHMAKIRSMKK